MALYAKVVFESPLPQLDRVFDYLVPEILEGRIKVGQRVSCPFGRSKNLMHGFVVELGSSVDYAGEISTLSEIVWEKPILPPWFYDFLRAVADRQAVALGDVLKVALPDRAVRVEKDFPSSVASFEHEATEGVREAITVDPTTRLLDYGLHSIAAPMWVHEVLEITLNQIAESKNSIVVLPDFRDVELVKKAFDALELSALLLPFGSELTKTERYRNYLKALGAGPIVVVGTRSAIFAPVSKLGAVVIWDDGDPLHIDQSSPYTNTRDLALLRQTKQPSALYFVSHATSLSVSRLIKMGYLNQISKVKQKPNVSFSEGQARVDGLAFQTIRKGLQSGPVLVQVATLGVARSAYCRDCSTRAHCRHCHGPLWINEKNQLICKVCSGLNLGYTCNECGQSSLKMGRAGSTRTVAEFGRAFPGVKILEATGASPVVEIDSIPQIVIATPEAAPFCADGYAAIVIIDCDIALSRDSLGATEQAIRQWANAIGLSRPQAPVALIGLAQKLGQAFAVWDLDRYSMKELHERAETLLPPMYRILSACGKKSIVEDFVAKLQELEGVSLIGLAPQEGGLFRAVVRFTYAAGHSVAAASKIFALSMSKTRGQSRNGGRFVRALTIKMDDSQVL